MLDIKLLIEGFRKQPLPVFLGLLVFAVAFLGSMVVSQHRIIETNERECSERVLMCIETRIKSDLKWAQKVDSIRIVEMWKTDRQIDVFNALIKKMKLK